jgi:hypothetical protein
MFFASRRVSFFCLAKKKETKEKATPCRLFPSVLAPHLGGCGTRAFSTQTVLAASHLPLKPKARQGEFKVKSKPYEYGSFLNLTVTIMQTLRHAEQRNQARSCRRGLFERSEFRRRLA